jgi:DNA repair protein RadC
MVATAQAYQAQEFRLTRLRETPVAGSRLVDTPERCAEIWRAVVSSWEHHDTERECLYVLCLSARRRLVGFVRLSEGTLDTILAHPRDVFRVAIVANAHAVVVMHNHPSGDPSPSEADIKLTRDLIRAGQLLKIECLDHVIIGQPATTAATVDGTGITVSKGYASLRELGYFYS